MMDAFHNGLIDEEKGNPKFSYRVAFVPKIGKPGSRSDVAVEFVRSDSDEAKRIAKVLLKEVDKKTYAATEVVDS